jgi:CheY-like chemotaxis protein
MKVLLVDDQRIIAEAIKRLLDSEKDLLLSHCSDPAQALKAAQDLAPGVDGLSLVQAYKADSALKEIPVIVLSSEEDADIKIKAFSLQASDYMVKIPHRAELISRIRSHAGAHRRFLELRELRDLVESSAWLEARARSALAIAKDSEAPVHYVASNLMFIGDAFRSLVRFRARLARLAFPPELEGAMRAAAEAEDLDFVFDDAPKALRQSQDEISRAASMIRLIRSFKLRPKESEPVALDSLAVLKDALSSVKESLAAVADLKCSFQEGLPKAFCRPGELPMAFLLLLLSSAGAIEGRFGKNGQKGLIEISARLEGGEAVFEFKDNGLPVPPGELKELFSPVYGRSRNAPGLRLNFYAVRLIAEASRGSATLPESSESSTSAVLRLPAAL